MRFKPGDRVRIKSLDWYDQNINCGKDVVFSNGYHFTPKMTRYCDDILTIVDVCERASFSHYIMEGVGFVWTDDMIEGLAEKNVDVAKKEIAFTHHIGLDSEEIHVEDGFEFQDENGKSINARKVKIVKKKPKYPATYEECKELMNITWKWHQEMLLEGSDNRELYEKKLDFKLVRLKQLLICRDAYWKIAGDWEPDWDKCTGEKYCIAGFLNDLWGDSRADKHYFSNTESEYYNRILSFPTSEMRDAFYENFKELIESCKELL